MSIRITFLGTSAGVPVKGRNVTAQALHLPSGALWLLDCGEATQHQVMRAGLRTGRIERILITHLHGDHILGLPGMLMAIAIAGRTEPLTVCGPHGLRELLGTVLRITEAAIPYPLEIIEMADAGGTLDAAGGWRATAIPIRHRVACFAWLVQEPPRRGRFHPDRAAALGLALGPACRRLQRGETVTMPDGRLITPGEVMDPPRPGRRILLLGDTDDADACLPAAAGCDLAVREVTYESGKEEKAAQWGHSTAAMTGAWAARLGCRQLIITHFSSRYTLAEPGRLTVDDLVAQTVAAAPGVPVLPARDLWSWTVPD